MHVHALLRMPLLLLARSAAAPSTSSSSLCTTPSYGRATPTPQTSTSKQVSTPFACLLCKLLCCCAELPEAPVGAMYSHTAYAAVFASLHRCIRQTTRLPQTTSSHQHSESAIPPSASSTCLVQQALSTLYGFSCCYPATPTAKHIHSAAAQDTLPVQECSPSLNRAALQQAGTAATRLRHTPQQQTTLLSHSEPRLTLPHSYRTALQLSACSQ